MIHNFFELPRISTVVKPDIILAMHNVLSTGLHIEFSPKGIANLETTLRKVPGNNLVEKAIKVCIIRQNYPNSVHPKIANAARQILMKPIEYYRESLYLMALKSTQAYNLTDEELKEFSRRKFQL